MVLRVIRYYIFCSGLFSYGSFVVIHAGGYGLDMSYHCFCCYSFWVLPLVRSYYCAGFIAAHSEFIHGSYHLTHL